MSRHRNVRSLNYHEEYDGYYDVYGHSVEDEYSISPSVEKEFMYDRSQQHQFSAFLHDRHSEEDIQEEDEDQAESEPCALTQNLSSTLNYLNEIDGAKLKSCLEEIRNVVGDTVPENELIASVMKNNFDVEKSLNTVLTKPPSTAAHIRSRDKTDSEASLGSPYGVERGAECPLTFAPRPPAVSSPTPVRSGGAATKVTKGFNITPDTTTQKVVKDVNEMSEGGGSESRAEVIITECRERGSSPGGLPRTPARSKESVVDAAAEYNRQRSQSKQLLNLVVIGHVDAGKSTLMGHLLYMTGNVNKKTMHKYETESRKLGKQSFMYAWVLDETGEERTRGITMDVGLSKFETDHRLVTLLDAPGHKDFIPNMITGAAQADVAVLVVDATRGEFETGFESGGQTREHALLVRSLGVSQLAVAVNKLDTVGWSEERFLEIQKKLSQFLRQAGFKESDVTYIPCSGLTGDNLVTCSEEPALASWYQGPTLVQVIDMFTPPERPVTKPFRLCVSDVFKGMSSGFCVSGRVESGLVQVGDKAAAMPGGDVASIKGIAIDDVGATVAFAGDHVVLSLTNIDMQSVSLGCVLCDPAQPVKVTCRFRARIVVFGVDTPITKGFPVVVHYQNTSEPAVVRRLVAQLHKGTGEILKKRPRCLTKNTSAVVELEMGRPICVELYKDVRELGRFMLRSRGATIAAGLVTEVLDKSDK